MTSYSLDLLSSRLQRRWKSWKRGKPCRDYAWLALSLVMNMSEIAQEKQAGDRGKIMAFERRLWEREALGEASSAEAWIEQATTLLSS